MGSDYWVWVILDEEEPEEKLAQRMWAAKADMNLALSRSWPRGVPAQSQEQVPGVQVIVPESSLIPVAGLRAELDSGVQTGFCSSLRSYQQGRVCGAGIIRWHFKVNFHFSGRCVKNQPSTLAKRIRSLFRSQLFLLIFWSWMSYFSTLSLRFSMEIKLSVSWG